MSIQNNISLNSIKKGVIRLFIISLLIASLIAYSDYKGYFNPDQANDHTKKKWDTFYAMNEEGKQIDIMLFGNSHLYTGINPKNLSLALESTAFIFASPGTNTVDNYFALLEAVKTHKPSLVIIETYGLNESVPHDLEKGPLSNQIVSFSARKDFWTKLYSTPTLFAPKNYLYAWSTTLRNHDYIFTNKEQLKKNKQLIANKQMKQALTKGLYLGRYVRFTSGIEQDVLEQYATNGAPVDGSAFKASDQNALYAAKIKTFCEEENIPLLFLTLPMYEKHISEYEYWDKALGDILEVGYGDWINMQTMPHYKGFDLFAFENTYKESQHMTYNGSILASCKLASYIKDSMRLDLPNKRQDVNWHQMFYGGEGYFENFNPATNDENNYVVASKRRLQNANLNSLLSLTTNNGGYRKLLAKLDKSSLTQFSSLENLSLELIVQYQIGSEMKSAKLSLQNESMYNYGNEVLFSTIMSNVKLTEVLDGVLIVK